MLTTSWAGLEADPGHVVRVGKHLVGYTVLSRMIMSFIMYYKKKERK